MRLNFLFRHQLRVFTFWSIFCLQSCAVSIPKGVKPVAHFELQRYLGKWHEIARFDHWFERGLEQVTATYSQQKNGTVRVQNEGINSKTGKQKTAIGKAKFVDKKDIGHLKVSFFGPFYSSYIVFYLEEDYSVALVCGDTKDYCWILAREPSLGEEALNKYLEIAEQNGFDRTHFTYPSHAQPVGM